MTSTLKIDNKLIALGKRYSDAILEVANTRNQLDAVLEDLKNVSECLNLVVKMKEFLAHPVISFTEKKELIQAVFQGKIEECTLNLLFVLLEKNRITLLDTIRYCYEESMDNIKNVVKIEVVSAVDVDEDLKQRLQQKLEAKLQKSVKFDFSINPEIIAGLILKINDKTIDGSMATKLDSFTKVLR